VIFCLCFYGPTSPYIFASPFSPIPDMLTQRISELQQTVLAATQLQQHQLGIGTQIGANNTVGGGGGGGGGNVPVPPPTIQQLLTPFSAANFNSASLVGNGQPAMGAVGRKTSMSAQLRVPNDYGGPPAGRKCKEDGNSWECWECHHPDDKIPDFVDMYAY
jgi:hypothetical protein